MPELPEVESVVRALRPRLEGRRVDGVQECFPGVFERGRRVRERWPARIERVSRRAKLVVLELAGDRILLVHLRMTGHLSLAPRTADLRPHTHVRIRLDGPDELRFVDPRRFGRVRLESARSLAALPFWAALGPEPLGLDPAALRARLGGTRAGLKAALLDQRRLAGIGNIYADEILFDCGLNPRQPANTVLDREWAPLLHSIRRVLDAAIAGGGSTIRDYRSVDGEAGGFTARHRVFGRDGQPCPTCGTPVRKIRVAGRGTHFCPRCQPLRRRRPRRQLRGSAPT